MLQKIEETTLIANLRTTLDKLHAQLTSMESESELAVEIEGLVQYVEIARALAGDFFDPNQYPKPEYTPPRHSDPAIQSLLDKIMKAEGIGEFQLFGQTIDRNFDFSLFKPRGHYTASVELMQYFRATMFLGRVQFRLIPRKGDSVENINVQTRAAVLLAQIGAEVTELLETDQLLEKLIGESDNATPAQLVAQLKETGLTNVKQLLDSSMFSFCLFYFSYFEFANLVSLDESYRFNVKI